MNTHTGSPHTVATKTPPSVPAWSVGLRAVASRGLLDRRSSVLVWGGSLGALTAFMTAIYPSVQSSIEQVTKSYPAGLKEAFGAQAMSTVEGYVHAEMFSLIVPLALGYFAVRAAATPTVGAEERGHLETILALPLSRTSLLAGSYLVAALSSAVILALIGTMTFVAGRLAGTHISLELVAAGAAGVWPLALFAAGLAALAAGVLHRALTVTGLAMGTLVAMYALDVAGRLTHGLHGLRWISVFRYYGAPMRHGIDPAAFAEMFGAGLVLLAVGAVLFERRDIFH